MFIAGSDPKVPELCVSGLKGCMRYIWRSTQCADNIRVLREREGELFGNAFGGEKTRRSQIMLQIRNDATKTEKAPLLPHRMDNEYHGENATKTFSVDSKTGHFDLLVQSFAGNHDMFVSLFILTSLLYGFGRRSRKGMGTIEITGIEGDCVIKDCSFGIDNIFRLLKTVTDKPNSFEITTNGIKLNDKIKSNYPYIEHIHIIKPPLNACGRELIKKIGISLHNFSSEEFKGYIKGNKRFASSLLLSTTPEPACVVTQLHCTVKFNVEQRKKFLEDLQNRIEKCNT
jgi:CRISPR-associated protein Cmr1